MRVSSLIKTLFFTTTLMGFTLPSQATETKASEPKIESNIVAIPEAPNAEDIIASVGEHTFTWGELCKDVNMLLEMLGNTIPEDQKSNLKEIARQRIVQTFIIDSLIKIAAKKEKVTITPEMRENALKEFEAEQGIPFDVALSQLPPAVANHNRESFELRLLEMALLDTVVFKDIKLDETKLNEMMAEVATYCKEITDKLATYHTAFKEKKMTIEEAASIDPDFFPPQIYVEFDENEFAQLQFPPTVLEAIKATPKGELTDILTIESGAGMDVVLQGFFLIITKPDTTTADNADAKALMMIEALKKQLDEGANFATLAKTHSACPSGAHAGGDLGEFSRGMMVKPFEDAAFAQPIGEVGPIVKTDFGYHIIKVTARDEAAGKVTASHILIRPMGQNYKVVPVMAMLPVQPSREELTEILLEELKTEAAAQYFDTLRKELPIKSTLYPNLAK
ncbi:MAG: peptidylprolyl isomerase [bacterium]|nr:peptidylprolyl isomerase [bacterium]